MAGIPLYIFNPEHDLALASGEANYMPPASARRMATDLALLPVWYAEAGSAVLASSAYNLDFLEEMRALLDVPVRLVTEPELADGTVWDVRAWGWNPALNRRLAGLGVDERSLASPGQLEKLRLGSHRSSAVGLLPRLRLGEYFCGESFWLTCEDDWRRFVESRDSCLLKAPLSGSGKGLNWCRGVFTSSISGWCLRVGRSQGGVVGEPIYNKVEDFAMEFRSSGGGRVSFAGYSQFSTTQSGAYESNLLLSDAAVERNLSSYVPLAELHKLRDVLGQELSALFGSFYTGYLGVDMMLCRFPEYPFFRIHPCVEINLRMNMGVVARLLYDRYIHPDVTGRFSVACAFSDGEALERYRRMQADFPLRIEGGRVCSGYLPLVPVTSRSRYSAYVHCG